jgi:glycosyltransferase involved in cell wall biosynthesis
MAFDKKLTIITTSFAGGGAQRIAVNLANFFCEAGYSVDLVAFCAKGPYLSDISKEVRLIDLNVKRALFAIAPLRKYVMRNRDRYYLSVIRDANLVLSLASIICKPLRMVFREANTFHGLSSLNVVSRMIYSVLLRVCYVRCDSIIANSYDTKIDLLRFSPESNAKAFVIPNPLKIHDYDIVKANIIGSKAREGRILAVGRLEPQKNFSLLLRAFKRVVSESKKEVSLTILGDGTEYGMLDNLIATLGLRGKVELAGFQKDVESYYAGSDIFVLSSYYEGFGNVLVEALSAGMKVVSTSCPGGPRDILKDGEFGELVDVGDEEGLAKAITRAIGAVHDPVRQRARALDFSVESVGETYQRVLFNESMKLDIEK